MHYLAIDPGKTTGWAAFDEHGECQGMGKIQGVDKFLDWLEEQEFKELILEVYRNRPGWINSWSEGPTQQHIGAITRIQRKKKAKLHKREAANLPIACKIAGVPYSRDRHLDDQMSAFAHGVHFLVERNIRKHRMDKT